MEVCNDGLRCQALAWAPLYIAIDALRLPHVLNFFIAPWERATVYTGDQVAATCCGSLDESVTALNRLLVELGALLRDARARVVVATPETAAVASESIGYAPEARTLVLTGRPAGGDRLEASGAGGGGPRATDIEAWDAVLASGQGSPAEPYATWFDSPGFWLYTSGTTGTPKAAMHRHGAIARVCETYASQVLGITPDDRWFSAARLFFAYGLGNSFFFPLAAGATAILDPARATTAEVTARLAADRPTLFFSGPAFLSALLTADVPAAAFWLGAAGRVGGRGAARRDLPAVHRALRRGHHRRARLRRGPAHLHLEHPRCGAARDIRHRCSRVRRQADPAA